MKTMLSIPRTISRAASVRNAIHACGSVIHSMGPHGTREPRGQGVVRRCTPLRGSRPRRLHLRRGPGSRSAWRSRASSASRSARSAFTLGMLHAPEEGLGRLAREPLALVEAHEPLERFAAAARRHLGRETREVGLTVRDAAADHHEVLRDGAAAELAHAALEADARDVVLAAAVRAAADLDVEVGRLLGELGPRRDVLAAAAAPRPRDCVTARRHDSAPGQLVTSAMRARDRLARARPRRAGDAGPSRRPRAPSAAAGSGRASCARVPSPYAAARSRSTRSCAPVRSPSGTVTVAIDVARLLLRAHVPAQPSARRRPSATDSRGSTSRQEARAAQLRRHAPAPPCRRAAGQAAATPCGAVSTGGVVGIEGQPRAALRLHLGERALELAPARPPSPCSRIRNFIRLRCLCL